MDASSIIMFQAYSIIVVIYVIVEYKNEYEIFLYEMPSFENGEKRVRPI